MAASSEPEQKTASKISDVTEKDIDTAVEMMKDGEKLRQVMKNLKEDGVIKESVEKFRGDSRLTNKTMNMAKKAGLDKQLGKMSMKEKIKMKKKAEAMAGGRSVRPAESTVCVLILPNRKFGQTYLPNNFESEGAGEFEGWVSQALEGQEGLFLFYDPNNKFKNRLASNLAKKAVGQGCIIYRKNAEGVLVDLKPAEVEPLLKN